MVEPGAASFPIAATGREPLRDAISCPARVAGAIRFCSLCDAICIFATDRRTTPYRQPTNTMSPRVPTVRAANLLSRTMPPHFGCRSSPVGASIGLTGWLVVGVMILTPVGTANFDSEPFALFTGPEHQVGPVKQTIHDVRLALDAIVRHLAFAVVADDQQNRRFPVLHLGRHLQVCLFAVVEHSQRPDVLVAAMDVVAEVQALRCHKRWEQLGLLWLPGSLRQHMLLPPAIVIFGWIFECHA